MLTHWRAGFNPRADTPGEILSADGLGVLSLNEQQLAKYGEQYGGCKRPKIVTVRSTKPTPGPTSGESYSLKRYMHPSVHCSTVYNSQDMEAT